MTHLIDPATPATMAANIAVATFDRIFREHQMSTWLAGIFAAVERREGPNVAETLSSRNVSVAR